MSPEKTPEGLSNCPLVRENPLLFE